MVEQSLPFGFVMNVLKRHRNESSDKATLSKDRPMEQSLGHWVNVPYPVVKCVWVILHAGFKLGFSWCFHRIEMLRFVVHYHIPQFHKAFQFFRCYTLFCVIDWLDEVNHRINSIFSLTAHFVCSGRRSTHFILSGRLQSTTTRVDRNTSRRMWRLCFVNQSKRCSGQDDRPLPQKFFTAGRKFNRDPGNCSLKWGTTMSARYFHMSTVCNFS